MKKMTIFSNNKGFTLIEMVIVLVVLGLVSIAISPAFQAISTSRTGMYFEKQERNNNSVARGLLNYAGKSTSLGTLPAPYTGGGLLYAPYNPADATAAGLELSASLLATGIDSGEINDDGTFSNKARVYQRVTGLSQNVPLYFQSGPLVTLAYQFGVVYQTDCSMTDAGCYTGLPGDSVAMTAGNYNTWDIATTDHAPAYVSTLVLQKSMLRNTVQRLEKIKAKLLEFQFVFQTQASASDATNFFPGDTSTDLSGSDPSTNQGCHDGWYDLTTTDVLSQMGMSSSEFGVTAWGGAMEYCRDYEPDGTDTSNADMPPHYAAIRIHKNVSTGGSPDNSVIGNNVFITF